MFVGDAKWCCTTWGSADAEYRALPLAGPAALTGACGGVDGPIDGLQCRGGVVGKECRLVLVVLREGRRRARGGCFLLDVNLPRPGPQLSLLHDAAPPDPLRRGLAALAGPPAAGAAVVQ
jgi:hypothetical protein